MELYSCVKTPGGPLLSPQPESAASSTAHNLPFLHPSSAWRKPFICHSYENCWGGGGILPFLELDTRYPLVYAES